jgi:hypothetical protein
MEKLKAFHGKQEIKDKFIARLKEHYMLDEIIKGLYWEKGRGCAVGCTIHSGNHKNYETELGIYENIARLEDLIFEELPLKEAKKFPLQFVEAIPVGADTSKVIDKFLIKLLGRSILLCDEDSAILTQRVIDLLKDRERNRKELKKIFINTDAAAYAAGAAAAAYAAAAYAAGAAGAAAAYAAGAAGAAAAAYAAGAGAYAAAAYAAGAAAAAYAAGAGAYAAYAAAAYAAGAYAAGAGAYAAGAAARATACPDKETLQQRDDLLQILRESI